MTTTTLPFKSVTYNVLNDLTVKIKVFNNPYGFQLDHLFEMAARINKKRSFLFVSKVLGKHLAVDPKISLLAGHLLAMRYMEVVHGYKDARIHAAVEAIQTKHNAADILQSIMTNPIELPGPVTCIGFAETATALGHSVFSSFNEKAKYIHTTRIEMINLDSVIHFEEEHSHATSHRIFAADKSFFCDDSEVLLIDDEITTGKTIVNIIRTIKEQYPAKKKFSVVSILDWRSDENREKYRKLEAELGITIYAVSLLEGTFEAIGTPSLKGEETNTPFSSQLRSSYLSVRNYISDEGLLKEPSVSSNGRVNSTPFLTATGRFGLSKVDDSKNTPIFKAIGEHLREKRKGKKTVVIGTEEFMYVPMRIASHMGEDVYFQSTTRSPIHQSAKEGYLIHRKFFFDSPENPGVANFLYNIHENQYDEIFVLIERTAVQRDIDPLLGELKRTKIPFIQIVNMTEDN